MAQDLRFPVGAGAPEGPFYPLYRTFGKENRRPRTSLNIYGASFGVYRTCFYIYEDDGEKTNLFPSFYVIHSVTSILDDN